MTSTRSRSKSARMSGTVRTGTSTTLTAHGESVIWPHAPSCWNRTVPSRLLTATGTTVRASSSPLARALSRRRSTLRGDASTAMTRRPLAAAASANVPRCAPRSRITPDGGARSSASSKCEGKYRRVAITCWARKSKSSGRRMSSVSRHGSSRTAHRPAGVMRLRGDATRPSGRRRRGRSRGAGRRRRRRSTTAHI